LPCPGRDTLLDQPAAETGLDQTHIRSRDRFRQAGIGNPLPVREAGQPSGLENPHGILPRQEP
jgi:hypothetical protein